MANFSLSMDKILKGYDGNIENIVKKTVFDFAKAVIKDTPIETGRLKGNWIVSIDAVDTTEKETLDKSGNNATSNAKSLIFTSNIPRYKYYIQNNLEYANKIEYGGSKLKAPQGMVRINILKFNKFLQDNSK